MKIMGILNVTPDSFSDGGKHTRLENALTQARSMLDSGADIIDLGGESTRPGYVKITEDEEITRIAPVLEEVRKLGAEISIDTYKARVADYALSHGATILNDIWALQYDPDMAGIAASAQGCVILMHNQENSLYEEDLLISMKRFLDRSIELALRAGVKQERLVLDPGIGFGKTHAQNWEVLKRLTEFVSWGFPVLLGTSRKGMYGTLLGNAVTERLAATLATSVYAALQGVAYLRVHDVKAHVDAIKVLERIHE